MSENSVINENEVKNDSVSDDEVLDKLAYTRKRYLTPKEIAAFVLVNFGQKNLSQFISANKDFFMVQFMGLSTTANANINLFSTIYDAVDDTVSGLIIDRTRTRWGRVRPFFILPLPLWILGGITKSSTPPAWKWPSSILRRILPVWTPLSSRFTPQLARKIPWMKIM